MAYPPAYVRAYSFTDWETTHPGEPKPGNQLDAEYDAVSNALTGTQDALALIQRSDGALANDSVGEDQLQDGILDGIVDGVTADAEAAAAAAAASAGAAASSASAAATSATDATTQAGIAAGHAATAGVSQSIAQGAAVDAADSAAEADTFADVSVQAANDTAGSVAACEAHVERAFEWAELLTGPVLPAPPGWPEAVDDGMFSSKWWAIRARNYNAVHEIDLGTAGTDIGNAFDIWDAIPGNDLADPPGLVYATWGTPPLTYVLTDPSDPSDPNSWLRITGLDGPPGPPNTLTIGTVTTGAPSAATITGVSPNQVLNLTLEQGPQGIPGPAGPAGAGSVANPTALVGLTPVDGVAVSAIRSDGAPALSQAIAPTWTAQHVFAFAGSSATPNILVSSAAPNYGWYETAAAVNNRRWDIRASSEQWLFRALADDGATSNIVMFVDRTATAVDALNFGNAVNNPAYNFLGAGTATFSGTVDLLGPLRATGVDGVAGQVLSTQGAGLPPVWRTSSGGSIELGYNFSTSVGTANPGSQKMSMNSAVYASVNILVFNALAMTNFDANTILSLLQTGNRIYIQQRNDASKAVVYEVTGPGTNMTGYWTIPVVIIQSRGTLFAANADLNCVFILSVSSTSLANPTALVGLTAVNGSATTGMRSDAAPPLDLAIAPTWSGIHTYSNVTPRLRFTESDQSTDEQNWDIAFSSKAMQMRTWLGAFASGRVFLEATRGTSLAITSMSFGNATDNPTFNFLGTGVVTSGGVHRGPDGTLLLPTYSFTSDPNTGFSSAAADAIAVSCGGAIRARFNATADALRIHATQAQGACHIAYYDNGQTTRKCYLGYGDTNTDHFYVMNECAGSSVIIGTVGSPRFQIASDGQGYFNFNVNAPSYTTSSARAVKRETGAPSRPANILARLRPIMYRLLAGGDKEQLGLIAEEVHEVCPQLSDGKTVAYDRLAILLLAAWQDEHFAPGGARVTTGYNVSGVGDLDALFAPRVSAAVADTGFKSNGGVDLAQRFEPRGATTAIANTNFKSGSTDLAQIFKGIAAGTITITDQNYSTTRVLPSSASVGYTLENDGDVIRTINATPTDVGDWIVPKASAPGAYECRATLVSGIAPTSGSALATWLALTTLRSWGLARSTLGTNTCVLLIEIRLGGTTLGSCQVTMTVTCET